MDDIIKDPVAKTNLLFMILGIMIGVLLSIFRNFMCDPPDKRKSKGTSSEGGDEDEDEWTEEEDSEDADASNANEE